MNEGISCLVQEKERNIPLIKTPLGIDEDGGKKGILSRERIGGGL